MLHQSNVFTGEINYIDWELYFSAVKTFLLMDLLITNMQLFCFARCKLMAWSFVNCLWIIVMLLLAVWTLTVTAPIPCRGSIFQNTFISVPKIRVIQVWNDREHTKNTSHWKVLSLAVIHSWSTVSVWIHTS